MSGVKQMIFGLLGDSSVRKLRYQASKLRNFREFATDAGRYVGDCAAEDRLAYSGLSGRHLETQLIKDYHRVEKGLALKSPKRPFGRDVEMRLRELGSNTSGTDLPVEVSESVDRSLEALKTWNMEGTVADDAAPTSDPRPPDSEIDFERWFSARHSVRDFDCNEAVSEKCVETAILRAMRTPSVCNRQPWRVHVYRDPSDIGGLLRLQNGNAGFRDSVPLLFIVTVDRRLFSGAGERNQRWIDGGLFSMTLVWALHSLGISSCMLNWSMTNSESDGLRAKASIPVEEDIIMMLAAGYAREGHRVARSSRRSLHEVAILH